MTFNLYFLFYIILATSGSIKEDKLILSITLMRYRLLLLLFARIDTLLGRSKIWIFSVLFYCSEYKYSGQLLSTP
ncbi:hypothetical protein BML2537_25200 [Providencia stuartii]|nr:hypothetical protein BML2537_25200 [Providencia stuartii]